MTGSAEKRIELVIPVSHLDLAIWAVKRATEEAFADMDEALVTGLGELIKKTNRYWNPDGDSAYERAWTFENTGAKDQERRELVSSLEEFFTPLRQGDDSPGSSSIRKVEVLMNLQVFLIDNLRRPISQQRQRGSTPGRTLTYFPTAVKLSLDENRFLPDLICGAMIDLALERLSSIGQVSTPGFSGSGFPKDHAELVGVLNYWRTARWLLEDHWGPTFSGVSYNLERHDR